EHLLEVRERQVDGLAARRSVLADGRVDRAGVVVGYARGRAQRLPGQLGRVEGWALARRVRRGAGRRAGQSLPPGFRAFFERARDGETLARQYTPTAGRNGAAPPR